MKNVFITLLVLFLFSCLQLEGQEICDNSIDDNGNGLIDLNDSQCVCDGIGVEFNDVTDMIPNPNFEEMDCCPNFISQVTACLTDWIAPSLGTPDYQNTCDFVMSAAYEANIHPFPSGNGVVGMICAPSWMEYIGACLAEPLEAGQHYEFRIKIAFTPILMSGNYPLAPQPPPYPPVSFALFGNETCSDMNMNGVNCPPVLSNAWDAIGSNVYNALTSDWTTLIIRFTPQTNITGFIFGPACNVPQPYQSAPVIPYFWIDDMELYELLETAEIEIGVNGQPCDDDLELNVTVDPPGGFYQWYFDGIAIPGATDEVYFIPEEEYLPGRYHVRYSIGNECLLDSLDLFWILPEPSEEEVFFCAGASGTCAGQTFYTSGDYEVNLITPEGCDSTVTCIMRLYPEIPDTELAIGICASEEYQVCGNIFTETGLYEINCPSINGCDSLISLNLQKMTPQAFVVHPGEMDCDTTIFSILDGSFSNTNEDPNGLTLYRWTGPVNGIVGQDDLPEITVHYPGTYCLELVFESNGASCSDQYCIDIERPGVLPDKPAIFSQPNACINSEIQVRLLSGSYNPELSYLWTTPVGINILENNDSLITFTTENFGTYRFCLATENFCGISDSTCVIVNLQKQDTSHLLINTCNPNHHASDTIRLQNQFGCDSLIIRNYMFVEADSTFIEEWVCTAIDVRRDTLMLMGNSGCDSLVFINFRLANIDTVFIEDQRCDITEIVFDTISYSGQYCDSIVLIKRIPLPSDTIINKLNVCDTLLAGIDTLFLINRYLCDSLVITERTFKNSDTLELQFNTCDVNQVGNEETRFTNQFGCDSIVITTHVLAEFTFSEQTIRICGEGVNYVDTIILAGMDCDSFVFIFNQYFSLDTTYLFVNTCDPNQVGIEEIILSNQNNCDSLIIIESIFRESPISHIQSSTCNEQLAGVFIDTLQNSFGCDSLIIRDISYAPLDTLFLYENTCIASEAGQELFLFSTSDGCDSIVIIERIFRQSDTIILDSIRCDINQIMSDTLFLINRYGCDSLYINMYRPEPTPLFVDLGPDRNVKEGEVVIISPDIRGHVSHIIWKPDGLFSCPSCIEQQFIGNNDMEISIQLISNQGCIAKDSMSIRVIPSNLVYIPSAFSPNKDGINDRFTVYGGPRIKIIKSFSIFDRWGNQVYGEENLPPNDPNHGWDGIYRDREMDPAVFVYHVIVEFIDGTDQSFSGEVQLLR